MITFFAITLLLFTAACSANAAILEPCETEFLAEYFSAVERSIDRHVSSSSAVSFTILPSFYPEWGLRVSPDGEVTHVVLSRSVWEGSTSTVGRSIVHDFASVEVDASVKGASVPASTVAALLEAMHRLLNDMSPQPRGLDGTTYRITVDGVCGEVWSPELREPGEALVHLVEALARTPAQGKASGAYVRRVVRAIEKLK